jgi:hypothetical protein
MRAFLAAVLSVIAVGVVLIAYGLLAPTQPRAAALYPAPTARPMLAGERVMIDEGNGYVRLAPSPYATGQALAYPVSDVRAVNGHDATPAPQPLVTTRETPRQTTRPVSTRTTVKSGRDWTKTALVIGGGTAAGAGLGGIIGGKKGALIGAAIGGGAGSLFEVTKR